MSRWHLETCMTPDVVVSRTHISCKICNQAPNIDRLVANSGHQNLSVSLIPPDEPYGAYNLSWPPGVPYTTTRRDVASEEPLQDQREARSNDLEGSMSNAENAIAYEKALEPDKFRLICLPNTNDVDAPIHLTLETYNDERYPEYETMSYTWAGEDGDDSLCKPVFVAPTGTYCFKPRIAGIC
ncbi:hypothetical protein B0T21DRAFT_349408 [Apiosordaria backusii]|uniref:Uncharacterized protein n=1 Tax=Apiosordaria backusii TaxID=314023 RepID=A0AA40EEJ0_9PEZI|nr:hypothetical protein B0T21DRAFT_349408 [Apiosordaria backusii]